LRPQRPIFQDLFLRNLLAGQIS